MKSNNRFGLQICLALGSGMLMVAAFAPLSWWWLSFPCLAILVVLQLNATPRQAFQTGLAFGYGLYGAGVSWVYVSLHVYGGMPLWMGAIAVLLFAGLLALFVALPCWIVARLFDRRFVWLRGFALLALWPVFEWGKSWVLTGFPWLDIGYTQTPSWLFGFAPLGGVYLVSFVVFFIALVLGFLWQSRKSRATLAVGFTLIGLVLVLGASLRGVIWSQDSGELLTVGIVQPNTPINKKWQPEYRDQVIQNLQTLSAKLVTESNQRQDSLELLVWPETALPLYLQQTADEFWSALTPPDTILITGLVDSPEYSSSYNAAVVSCDGEQQIYRKRHLVPFGEYLPLRFVFGWILDFLQLPMSDFSSWSATQNLQCGSNVRIGLSICYEDAFAAELAKFSGNADLLVNISEDAWFGDSLAPHQRLQMAQMRARELSRPMVRSANSGPSAIIDQHGRVLAKSGQFKAATLYSDVQPQVGQTPFKQFGNWIIWVCGAVFLVLMLAARQRLRAKIT